MASKRVVGVAGATGAVGKEILAVLDKAPWRPAEVVAFASPGTEVSYVEYGEQQVPVSDLDLGELSGLDVLFLAVPGDVARKVGEAAVAAGVPVVDLSGVFVDDGDVPIVVPWVNPEALSEAPERAMVAVPRAASLLLAAILGPLRRADVVVDADATVLLPASAWGRKGIEELSSQVVAMFNSGTPPRKVFDGGLAFDLIPQIGVAGATGRTDAEDRVAIEVAELTGLKKAPAVELFGVPVFSGVSASVRVRLGRKVDAAQVGRLLADGGVTLVEDVRQLPKPRRVEGKPFASVGRIRVVGDQLTVWCAMDNLRGAATAAVATAALLLRQVSPEAPAPRRDELDN
jgi:aspartate-semialdehyde dehydrogenase